MSWSIAIFESDAVYEVHAWKSQEKWSTTWVLTAFDRVWREVQEKCGGSPITKVYLLSNRARHMLRKGHGTSPVVITDSGLEHAIEVVHPEVLALGVINRDLVFGVNSRKKLEEADVEFLNSKVALVNNKAVALGFLQTHPAAESHEKVLLEQLKNIRVFTSSQWPESAETTRLWTALLQAYISPLLEEGKLALRKSFGENLDVVTWTHQGWKKLEDSIDPLDWMFPELTFRPDKPALYFGWDEFWSIDNPEVKWREVQYFSANIISFIPRCSKLALQPTAIWQKGFWNHSDLTADDAGLEPGPMCWGRGLQPLAIDIWLKVAPESLPEVYSTRLQEKFMQRTLEVLLAQSHDRNRGFLTELDHLLASKLLQAHETNPQAIWYGPLAKAAASCLKRYFPKKQIECSEAMSLTESIARSLI